MTSSMWRAMLLGYALGSVPIAWLAVRWASGQDLRRVGSGNIGATNAGRASGWRLAFVVASVDGLKGSAAVALGTALAGGTAAGSVAGLGAVVGHLFPVWLLFHGGKGVATAAGAFALLAPSAMGMATLVFLAVLLRWRIVSAASIAAAIVLGPAVWITGAAWDVRLAAPITTLLIVWRHRENIGRLMKGTEPRLGAARRQADRGSA
ncbi:MAG: glycerol-3-phosphate 1-O-acyltransferase PlsY [Vicinamibacterales bacterium]